MINDADVVVVVNVDANDNKDSEDGDGNNGDGDNNNDSDWNGAVKGDAIDKFDNIVTGKKKFWFGDIFVKISKKNDNNEGNDTIEHPKGKKGPNESRGWARKLGDVVNSGKGNENGEGVDSGDGDGEGNGDDANAINKDSILMGKISDGHSLLCR